MWSIKLWVFPSGEVPVYLWMSRCGNIVLFRSRFFDVAKFTVLTPLSLLSWCRLSFPIVGLKIFSLRTFALNSHNLHMVLRKMIKNLFWFLIKLSFKSSPFSTLGTCTFRTMILHQRPLKIIYDILSLTNSTLLTADTILRCTKNPVPNLWFSCPFP